MDKPKLAYDIGKPLAPASQPINPIPAGENRLTPEQQKAFQAFIERTPALAEAVKEAHHKLARILDSIDLTTLQKGQQ